MPTLTYILSDGSSRSVTAASGASLMEAAVRNNVKGIDAECGGCLSCATCHVYVDPGWFAKLPAPGDDELDMLGFVAAERRPTSRLSCQIEVTEALDGLVVHVPPTQTAT
jgi:ferredoxin, 2Fe-2S